jgi:hypothetical protein
MTRLYTTDRGARIPATTRASVESVKGWLIPYYTETPAEGRPRYGLLPADFRKVVSGYACGECLADFGGVYMAVCPACGHERDVAADVFAEPAYWKPDPNDPDRAA